MALSQRAQAWLNARMQDDARREREACAAVAVLRDQFDELGVPTRHACHVIGCGRRTLWRWVSRGLIEPINFEAPVGVTRRFRLDDLLALRDRRLGKPSTQKATANA